MNLKIIELWLIKMILTNIFLIVDSADMCDPLRNSEKQKMLEKLVIPDSDINLIAMSIEKNHFMFILDNLYFYIHEIRYKNQPEANFFVEDTLKIFIYPEFLMDLRLYDNITNAICESENCQNTTKEILFINISVKNIMTYCVAIPENGNKHKYKYFSIGNFTEVTDDDDLKINNELVYVFGQTDWPNSFNYMLRDQW